MRRWFSIVVGLIVVISVLPAPPALALPTPAPVLAISPGQDWTHVNSCSPDTSYRYDYRSGMRVGAKWGSTCKWRTLMRFDLSRLVGATILDVNFAVTADHTGACGGAYIDLWRSEENLDYSTLTWNKARNYWYNNIEREHFTANDGDSCPKGDDPGLYEDPNGFLKSEIVRYLSNGWTRMALGMRAHSESDYYDWSYYLPSSATLQVTYNHAPTAPTSPQISTECGTSCTASGAQVHSGTPTLQAVPGDPNGGTLHRMEFEVVDRATRTVVKAASGHAVSEPSVGVARGWRVTPALPRGEYSWRARGCDTVICGAHSPWFDFTVDLDPPTGLQVSSTAYPSKSSGTWSGGVGVPGSFSFTAADASRYEIVLNGVSKGWVTGSAWTGDLVPNRDGVNVLQVRAADAAGNVTLTPYVHEFLVRPVPTASWAWGLNEGSGQTADSAPAGRRLGVTGTAAWGAGRSGGGALTFDGATRWQGDPVVDTTRSFTVTAWVHRNPAATAPATVLSQDGESGSGFRLQYRTDLDLDPEVVGNEPGWCFVMFAADDGAETAACSTEGTGPGWVHLAGVRDQASGLIRLYVNGANFDGTDTRPHTGSWSAGDKWVLGSAKSGGVRTQQWSGSVDRIAAYLKVLTQSEIVADGGQP